jgi:hypothetical protein
VKGLLDYWIIGWLEARPLSGVEGVNDSVIWPMVVKGKKVKGLLDGWIVGLLDGWKHLL